MAVTSDGATLYVAAFGSSKIGVFDTAALESRHLHPDAADHIAVSGGGPSGLVLDEAHDRLYVLTRFDNAVVGRSTPRHARRRSRTCRCTTPSRRSVVDGRPFLYDAQLDARATARRRARAATSSATSTASPGTSATPTTCVLQQPEPDPRQRRPDADFHPLKGPMTTQSLRGMANHGADALARRPHRRQRSRRRPARRGRGLQEVQRRVRRPARPRRRRSPPPTCRRSPTSSSTSPTRRTRSAPSTTRLDRRAARRPRPLLRPRSPTSSATATAATSLDPARGLLRHRRPDRRFEGETADVQDPAPAQRVPEGRHVRHAGGAVPRRRRQRHDQGPQVRGFGFLHDGSVDTLFRFHGAAVFDHVAGRSSRTSSSSCSPSTRTWRRSSASR